MEAQSKREYFKHKLTMLVSSQRIKLASYPTVTQTAERPHRDPPQSRTQVGIIQYIHHQRLKDRKAFGQICFCPQYVTKVHFPALSVFLGNA